MQKEYIGRGRGIEKFKTDEFNILDLIELIYYKRPFMHLGSDLSQQIISISGSHPVRA